ncbi:putative small lipoprotein YifL [Arthrobacter sp. W4I7]|nr:putative small lipoprotein YifL [Arthrobacter sp. W4I7]
MRRTVLGIFAALILAAATACTITTKDPGYVPPAPLPPMEQLEQAAVVDAKNFANGDGVISFITEDRTVACSLTAARGEHVNLPYEQNNFADTANNKLAIVPVAHCELAKYPQPKSEDAKDDCAGTNLGYLGGVALLTPDSARYGECRSGVTQMEATYGPKGSKAGALAQLQVLGDGQNLEGNGLRCSAYNGGVACGNVSAGVGFFVSPEHYELISRPVETASPVPGNPSKTP